MKVAKKSITAVLFSTFLASVQANAAQCDCTQIIGQCKGAVEIANAFGSPPSFGAELNIYSSERSCSKVEYYVDSTPYQTLLINKNKDTDSVFGTSPITAKQVKYSACRICKPQTGSTAQASGQVKETPSAFTGRWTGVEKTIFGVTHNIEANITVKGSSVTGTWYSHSDQKTSSLSGRISGTSLIMSILPDGFTDITFDGSTPGTLSYKFLPFGWGTLKKQD